MLIRLCPSPVDAVYGNGEAMTQAAPERFRHVAARGVCLFGCHLQAGIT
jgi:hypothetical protein